MRRLRITLLLLLLPAGCTFMRTGATLPVGSEIVRNQLVLHSDFKLPRRHRLLEELVALRGDIAERLDVPVSDEPIHVYLFDDTSDYRSYMSHNYPGLPDRRAFFVESDVHLAIYAHWGDRIAEDLRHEVSHGYLHAVTPNLPIWLDEGIAEYFEVPRGRDGYHAAHIELLVDLARRGEWEPDLRRLEQLVDMSDMNQRDYAESWLWVHLMLETSRERRVAIQHHLALFRQNGTAPPLSQIMLQVEPNSNDIVLEHLYRLAG